MAGSNTIRAIALSLLLPAATAATGETGCDLGNALGAFGSGDREAATAAFEACLASGQDLAQANFHLGIMARDAKRLAKAAELLGQAVALEPGRVPYRLEWAVTREWQGEFSAAEHIYGTVLDIEPGNLPARLGMARMAHWQGHLRHSLAAYRSILEDHPGHPGARSGLAFALLADNKTRPARRLFEQLLADNPEDSGARQGLEMLAGIRTQRLETTSSMLHDPAGRDIAQFRLTYTATPSYSLKWGLELVERENFATPPDFSGMPVKREVKSAQSLFLDYRLNAKSSVFGAWRREELPNGNGQHKLTVEWMHKAGDRHRVFAGINPAFIGGERVNLLSYGGYVFAPSGRWNVMAQYFHGKDRDYPSSRALSLSWNRTYGERNFLRLGASISETDGTRSNSMYASGVHHFSRAFAIRAGLVSNFSNDTREITLGVIYEF